MLCICNVNGDIIAVSPSSLNQGSIDANKIILLAPFAKSTVVSVLATLPNRLSLYPQLAQGEDNPTPYNMAAIDLDLGIKDLNGVAMNAWSYTLVAPMTQYSGTLTLQFLFTLPGGTLASSAANITVQRGSAWIAPEVSESDVQTIAVYLAAAQTASTNANVDAKAAELWATGTYIDNTDDPPTEYPAEPGDPQYQNNAKYYAELAGDSAEDAGRSRDYAWVYQERAENAKIAAQVAQVNSETAKNAAEAAKNVATSAQTGAEEAAARAEEYADAVGAGAASLAASINNQTYVLTLELKDAQGDTMSTADIDLPLESLITNIAYDDETKEFIFTLQNGRTTRVPFSDATSGLATDAELKVGLEGKVGKITAKLQLYGTDSNGDQTAYEIVTTTGNSQLAIMTQAAVTSAIENIAIPEISHGISEGSLTFNNTSNTAGSKAFRILSYNSTNKTYTLDSTSGISIGDYWSIAFIFRRTKYGYVTGINGNTITVSNFFIPSGKTEQELQEGLTEAYIYIVGKPHLGTTVVGENANAFGSSCIASGIESDAGGLNNISDGRYSITRGKGNITGYCGGTFGEGNENLGLKGFAANQGNYIAPNVERGAAFGKDNRVEANQGFAAGTGNIANKVNQMKVGCYSSNSTIALFTVGCGSSDTSRKNGFAVFPDGHGEVAEVAPTSLRSIVNMEYFNNALANAATVAEIRDGVLHVSRGLGVKVYRHEVRILAEHEVTAEWGGKNEFYVVLYLYSSDPTPITKETLLSRIPDYAPAWGYTHLSYLDDAYTFNTDYEKTSDGIEVWSWTTYDAPSGGFNYAHASFSTDEIMRFADYVTEV